VIGYFLAFLQRFQKPGINNLEDLGQRIRAEIEQISIDIIERSVQSVLTRVGECQMFGGSSFNIALSFIVDFVCLFVFI
jgi:hypothetical protein